MKLVIEALEIQDYPDTLRTVELTESDAFLEAEEKMDLARDMVMGAEYYASKEKIRSRLKYDLETLDQQMNQTRRDTSARMMRELTQLRIVTIVMTVILIALIVLTAWLSTLPLIGAAGSIRERKKIVPTGSREFRKLAESYNEMFDSLHPTKEDE